MGMCCKKKTFLIGWKKCMEYEVEGSRPRGRPRRTWKEVVQKDCQARKLNKEDAMDRGRWKKLIKIGWWSGWWVGECFFLVPAHPGSPGQRAVKRSLSLLLALSNSVYTWEKWMFLFEAVKPTPQNAQNIMYYSHTVSLSASTVHWDVPVFLQNWLR